MKNYSLDDSFMAGMFAGFAETDRHIGDPAKCYLPGVTPVLWGAWHATRYRYDRLIEVAVGLDALWLTPVDNSVVWVADSPMGFIGSIRCAVFDMFNGKVTTHGTMIAMRPGTPKKVRIYRIGLYASRVTKTREQC